MNQKTANSEPNEIITAEEFELIIGKILRNGFNVEDFVEFVISNYFTFPPGQKTAFFDEVVLSKIGFEQKITILREILAEEELLDDNTKRVLSLIHKIKDLRNKAAHADAHYDRKTGFTLQKTKYKWDTRKAIVITKQLAEQVENECAEIVKSLAEVHNRLFSKLRSRQYLA